MMSWSNLSKHYQKHVHSTFDKYKNMCDWNTSKTTNNNITNHIIKNYINTNKIGKTNYMEIGIGHGYAVDLYSKYFNNIILFEPNPIFIQSVDGLLKSAKPDKNLNFSYRFINDYIENDLNQHLTENERNNINLINISHVLYHIYPNNLHNVLDKICQNIAANNGISVITMFDDNLNSALYKPHLHFAQKLGINTNDLWHKNLENYLDNNRNVTYDIFKDEVIVKDMDEKEFCESTSFWIPSNLVVYTNKTENIFDQQDLYNYCKIVYKDMIKDNKLVVPQKHYIISKKVQFAKL